MKRKRERESFLFDKESRAFENFFLLTVKKRKEKSKILKAYTMYNASQSDLSVQVGFIFNLWSFVIHAISKQRHDNVVQV